MGEPPFLRRCANKTIRRLERPMVSVMRPGKMSMSPLAEQECTFPEAAADEEPVLHPGGYADDADEG